MISWCIHICACKCSVISYFNIKRFQYRFVNGLFAILFFLYSVSSDSTLCANRHWIHTHTHIYISICLIFIMTTMKPRTLHYRLLVPPYFTPMLIFYFSTPLIYRSCVNYPISCELSFFNWKLFWINDATKLVMMTVMKGKLFALGIILVTNYCYDTKLKFRHIMPEI